MSTYVHKWWWKIAQKLSDKFIEKKFNSNTEIIDKTNAYFEGLKKLYYTDDIKKLGYCYKCIKLKGDCKKFKKILLQKSCFVRPRIFQTIFVEQLWNVYNYVNTNNN